MAFDAIIESNYYFKLYDYWFCITTQGKDFRERSYCKIGDTVLYGDHFMQIYRSRKNKDDNPNTSNKHEQVRVQNIVNFTNFDELEEVDVDNPDLVSILIMYC